jgi:uncharacterized cupredoxin-like copper-binding protein
MKALITLAAASLIALSACGGTPVAGATGGTVNVTLTDSKITTDRTNVPAGSVTFVVKNAGTTTHELVVVKTDTAADKIPAGEEAGLVSEDGSQGETGDLDKGASKSITFKLEPGKYVLICNQLGHYAMGMHVPFTVTK